MQSSLFNQDQDDSHQIIRLGDQQLEYHHQFISACEAQRLFDCLLTEIAWRQEVLTLFGKTVNAPRLSCWMADSGLNYSYSNMTMQPEPWHDRVAELKARVSAQSKASFKGVLLNYYRDGKDSNGWHADDEPELGTQPLVASLSLGGSRDFYLRNKRGHAQKFKLTLQPGSLLIMGRGVQSHWQHQVPKRAQAQPRINLTFREIVKIS